MIDSPATPPPLMKRLAAPLGVAIAIAAWGATWIADPSDPLTASQPDDAFYYLLMSRSVAEGGPVAIDGAIPTSGFHPAWLFALAPLHGVGDGALVAARVLQLGLVSLLAFLMAMWAGRVVPAAGVIAVAPLCAVVFVVWNGLETPLAMVLLVCAYRARRGAVAGLLGGLAIAARLDLVIWIVPLLITRAAAGRSQSWPGIALAAAIAGPIPLLYWSQFGHPFPVSMAVKSSFPAAGWHPEAIPWWVWPLVPVYALGALSLVVRALGGPDGLRRTWAAGRRLPIRVDAELAFCAGGLVHVLLELTTLRWGAYAWHFAPHLLAIGWIAGRAATALHDLLAGRGGFKPAMPVAARPVLSVLALAAVVMVGSRLQAHAARAAAGDTFHQHAKVLAEWMRTRTPEGSRFATQDAGILGWFSHRAVMNLDGVASSWGYQEAIEAGELGEWLLAPLAEGGGQAGFLIEHYFGPDPDAMPSKTGVVEYQFDRVRTPGGETAGTLPLPRTLIVYQGAPFGAGAEAHRFIVWDIRGGDGG